MTTITQVNKRSIEHGVLIDLTLDGTTYYISNCYKNITYGGNVYQALAGFLTVSEIQSNISNANDEIQISLSAIPPTYIAAVLGQPIKGGELNIYRAFFDYTTQEVITGEIYKRFAGIISNYSVQEDIETLNQDIGVTHNITIIASSIMGVLENKYTGRRTNRQDFQIVYSELGNSSTDPSMDRVETLFNSSFDFGKPYKSQAASTVDNSSGGATYDGGGGASDGGGSSSGDGSD
jgi:uncharacterized membrane protein YgcG